jgi:hypothetical protein
MENNRIPKQIKALKYKGKRSLGRPTGHIVQYLTVI